MTAQDRTLRVFIATAISGEAHQALEQVIDGLRLELPSGVTWVRPEGIHLTLKFLGNVKREPLSRLQEAVASGVIAHSPFRLRLSGVGVFPNRRRPRVLWAAVQGELEALGDLRQMVEDAAVTVGFPPEGRPFSPHLTLGRVRRDASEALLERISAAVAAVDLPYSGPWQVSSVQTMRSILHPAGAEYTVLESAPLAGSGSTQATSPAGP